MDFHEQPELVDLRKAVSTLMKPFGGEYYSSRATAHDATGEAWTALGESGFLGVNFPEEYGGGGAGMQELSIVCEEAAAAGCPMLLMLVSSAICGEVLGRYGSDDHKKRWLPDMAAGRSKMVFAITEPGAGSNTLRLTTTATRDGDDWLLNGQKYYISGVDDADAILVVARSGSDSNGRARLSLFIVPTNAPGLLAQDLPVAAQLPEKQFTLFFDDVRVSADALIGDEGDGFVQVFHGLNPERIMGAALCVGVARYALDRATGYARDRQVWDQPIGAHQGVAHPLAEAKIETELASLMTRKAAWAHDQGLPAGEAANMAKFAAAEAGVAAVDQAIQTHGGNGMSQEYGLIPMWGMVRLLRIAPVSREMVLNYVAQHSLSLPRSY